MATHDYIISNASGAAVRADLNNALAAIATNNSSATAPTTTYAYQWWADTGSSPTVMKLRNAANSAWITLFQLDGEWTNIAFENGTAAAPSIYFKDSGTDTGIYSPGTDQVAITTGGTGRLFVDSSGRVGLGTSSPFAPLHINTASSNTTFAITRGTSGAEYGYMMAGSDGSTTPALRLFPVSNGAQGSEAVRIDASGRLGIGNTSPGSYATGFNDLVVGNHTGNHGVTIASQNTTTGRIMFADGTGATEVDVGEILYNHANNSLTISTNRSAALTIDSSGRLLVGASSAPSATGPVQIVDTVSPVLVLARNDTSIVAGNNVGEIRFFSNDSTAYEHCATIAATADGDYADGDKPTRLVFSTTPDGLSSPQEVFRINSASELVSVPVYNNTSAVAANMAINSSGKFLRATSSAKYKKDIETLQDSYADALLNVRPVWYRSTCKADNPSHGYWGFIAEEVAAIDPRLVFWKTVEVNYDENGSAVETSCDPEPEGVQYDRFVPHLLNLVKRQQEQIEAMEARLSALEAS
jgi:hypothetical protein